MIPVEEPVLPDASKALLSDFYKKTGYGPSDVLAFSRSTHSFLTRNGGKYKMTDGKIQHIAGPSADPSERL